MYTYKKQISIPFINTDAAGIVHFSRAAEYVEACEHEAMKSLGIEPMSRDGGWPKIHFDANFNSPLRYSDDIGISLELIKIGKSSLTWNWKISHAESDEIAWHGTLVTVHVSRHGLKMEISEEERKLLTVESI